MTLEEKLQKRKELERTLAIINAKIETLKKDEKVSTYIALIKEAEVITNKLETELSLS